MWRSSSVNFVSSALAIWRICPGPSSSERSRAWKHVETAALRVWPLQRLQKKGAPYWKPGFVSNLQENCQVWPGMTSFVTAPQRGLTLEIVVPLRFLLGIWGPRDELQSSKCRSKNLLVVLFWSVCKLFHMFKLIQDCWTGPFRLFQGKFRLGAHATFYRHFVGTSCRHVARILRRSCWVDWQVGMVWPHQ